MVCSSLAMTGAARPHMWYYYSGDNFGRKEPQLVSFYERDEKEPVVWESRRGDYVITLWSHPPGHHERSGARSRPPVGSDRPGMRWA